MLDLICTLLTIEAWVFAKERETIKTGISFDMPEIWLD